MRFPLLLYVILITKFSFGQQAYYVSNDGNNGNNGDLVTPFQTIQYGMDRLTTGDTLFLRGGAYRESCGFRVSGSAGMPVVIQAYNNERVVITGNPEEEGATISLFELQYVVIRGLEIAGNALDPGIYLDRCADVLIERNKIYGNETGIHLDNTNLALVCDQISIRNNFIYRNHDCGLVVGPEDMEQASGLIDSLLIRNNSFFNNDVDQSDRGEIQVSNAHNSLFINNIFYTNEQSLLGEVHEFFYELDFDHNAYYSILGKEAFQIYWNGVGVHGFEVFMTQTAEESEGVFANPLFLSVAGENPDLHLTPNSPLIGRADPDTEFEQGEMDIDGQARVNALPDIGADEYHQQIIICALGIFESTAEDDRVRLNWSGTCFSETGGKYLLQRSRDRQNWGTLGEIQSQLSKWNTEVFYEYFDEAPLEGLSFYRARFIDENGSYLDSNVGEVIFTSGRVLVYPNPVKDILHIIPDDEQAIKAIRIYDLSGKLVNEQEFSADQLSLGSLASGQYYIELLNDLAEIIERVIVFIL